MLTDKDVQKLIEVFATREEIKDLIEPLALQSDIDGFIQLLIAMLTKRTNTSKNGYNKNRHISVNG